MTKQPAARASSRGTLAMVETRSVEDLQGSVSQRLWAFLKLSGSLNPTRAPTKMLSRHAKYASPGRASPLLATSIRATPLQRQPLMASQVYLS